ncbi:RHS repeat-associated core domain-containing protein [Chromobacterium haemolyticum]|uniref:RHS repeat-associated core domain-containing protein n=1 Tax=Chromobacterium haemolyticum TaxID=394935 RepID=UPI0024468696|nr:RHS repeat-associated core domain-containing protein [Chromobacterium haemolyticum]
MDYQAWGQAREIIADAANKAGIRNPFRFQGQYQDEESGLHYNRHRYYDPEIGRFISRDPIGLMGDLNTHSYAPNPIEWVDPSGLSKKKGAQATSVAGSGANSCSCKCLNRREALNKAKDLAGIPRSQQPTSQWQVGDDVTKQGFKNYKYATNPTHHGRFYEYVDARGHKKVVVEHTNDSNEKGPYHAHAGKAKGDDPRNYDFRTSPYQKINDPKTNYHHIYYGCKNAN